MAHRQKINTNWKLRRTDTIAMIVIFINKLCSFAPLQGFFVPKKMWLCPWLMQTHWILTWKETVDKSISRFWATTPKTYGKSSDNMQPEYDVICMVKSDSMPPVKSNWPWQIHFTYYQVLSNWNTRIENFTIRLHPLSKRNHGKSTHHLKVILRPSDMTKCIFYHFKSLGKTTMASWQNLSCWIGKCIGPCI